MESIVFVGTGPINLLKGYLILQDAPLSKITFIDKNERIGGAWYSDKSPKNNEIECGCHIWTYCPEVYEYIENELNIELTKMKPAPVFKYKNLSFSYPLKSIKDSYVSILKNSPKRILGKPSVSKNNPEVYFSILNRQNKYPERGSQVFINRLISLLQGFQNVSFLLKTEISSIIADEKIVLKTSAQDIQASMLYLTSLSSVSNISTKKSTIALKHSRIDYIHHLIAANEAPKFRANYHRLVGDPIIHRIADISYQTNNEEQLFLIGIHESAYKSKSSTEILEHFKSYLVRSKIYNSEVNLKHIKEHIFPTYYINEAQREVLKDIHPKIKLSHSTDLMHGIYYVLKEKGLI